MALDQNELPLPSTPLERVEVELPRPDPMLGVEISADTANRWTQGGYEVWLLRGNVAMTQGPMQTRSQEGVLWIKRSGDFGDRQNLVIAYLEGDVHINYQRAGMPFELKDNVWFGELFTTSQVTVRTPEPGPEPNPKPAVFQRADQRRDPYAGGGSIRKSQFQPFDAQATPTTDPLPIGTRRLRAYPRGDTRVQAQWFPNPATQDWIAVIPSGVNLIVDGVGQVGTLDISADRLVLWTKSADEPDLSGESLQGEQTPLEIYLEGNVVFRQGDRVIYADRVYFDVPNQRGTLLQADVLAPVPSFLGLVRLRSEVIQQIGKDQFFAKNSTVTTSRFESPGYRLQASDVFFEDNQRPVVSPYTGAPEIDPATGEQVIAHQQTVTSNNNFLFLGPVPVLYWPTFKTDLDQPTYYIRRAQVRNDRIFGTQFISRFDMYQLLGTNRIAGTDWIAGPDYLSARGLGGGTTFSYARPDFLGYGGPLNGAIDAWGLIHDHGLDSLGSDRIDILPQSLNRGRVKGRHRQELWDGWRLTTELSAISDLNFLEQFYEREWDTDKDFTDGLELKKRVDNQSFSLQADTRINKQFTQTEHLPRGEHFMFGTPLLGDLLTWHEHTSLGYEKLRVESYPDLNPVDTQKLAPLPWEQTASGARLITRQEIDAPFSVGVFKVVPYALGEAGYWGQTLGPGGGLAAAGGDLSRFFGTGGVRASVPFWSLNPQVESDLFNVHGLAHKVTLEADFSYTDSSQPASSFPLYDPIDDDSGEHFRRRMRFNTYGNGLTPPQFDPVFYGVRSGLQNLIASPSMEVADSITTLRLNSNQRWQTKRGPQDRRRIIDWMILDAGGTIFPDYNRDNFGQLVGLVNYNYIWHIGDRTTLLSSGMFDFFNQGQKTVTVGMSISRPPRGQIYFGFYAINGPLTADVFSAVYNYRMSPKWISSAGITYDVAGAGLVGNMLALTRVGESFLTSFNFVADPYKQNVGVSLMLEPRIMPKGRLSMVGGAPIGVAGLSGLE